MNTCVHTWLYIGSKRQKIWRCTLCDEYRIDDPTPQRNWQGLTDEEVHEAFCYVEYETPNDWERNPELWCLAFSKYIEAKLKEKNT